VTGFVANLRLAWAMLLAHKGRSALASLGIIIGIAGVVAMVSAGSGARRKLDDRLESAGRDLIIVRPGGRNGTGVVTDLRPLTEQDAEAIRKEAGPLLVGVVPWQVASLPVSAGTRHTVTTTIGTWPDFVRVGGWRIEQGRSFDHAELQRAAPVCLIGQTVRRHLFPDTPNPVGEKVRVGSFPVHVIGVVGEKGTTPLGIDQDDQVFLPLSTVQRKVTGRDFIAMLLATATSDETVEPAEAAAVRALRRRHHLAPGAANDFDVSSVPELAGFAVTLTTTLQALVVVIASVSLVVGGIGIMNIMLASVTERTREIGIRAALGATPLAILLQFLTEAVLLTSAGGVAGILLGVAAAVGLARVADWPITVSPAVVLLAFTVTAGVGILFGYYPAWKASRLDTIAALNRE
jgi:putative ABC transport system permease protein